MDRFKSQPCRWTDGQRAWLRQGSIFRHPLRLLGGELVVTTTDPLLEPAGVLFRQVKYHNGASRECFSARLRQHLAEAGFVDPIGCAPRVIGAFLT